MKGNYTILRMERKQLEKGIKWVKLYNNGSHYKKTLRTD